MVPNGLIANFERQALNHQQNQRWDDADATWRQILAIEPYNAQARFGLANCLLVRGKFADAAEIYRQLAIELPDLSEIQRNLGSALSELSKHKEAAAVFRRGVALSPGDVDLLFRLADAYRFQNQFDLAIETYSRVLQLDPRRAVAHLNLGLVLESVGRVDEAIACYQKSEALAPDDLLPAGNRLFAMLHVPQFSAAEIGRQHALWNDRFARALSQNIPPHLNDPDPNRRLKIGYVSADFRVHAVALFLLPLLAHHHHRHFEIFCYSNVAKDDEFTDRMRGHSDIWRDIQKTSDAQLAQQIRDDQIDILIDLSLHTAGNRLLAFARKPAPVQATYLGYCGSTGLTAIDYRISDPYLDPPGSDESCYSEKTIRLPRTYWCYRSEWPAPQTNPLPAMKNGFVTFACFNHFSKISPATWQTWQSILRHVPNSRLTVHAPQCSRRNSIAESFARAGLDPKRLTFIGKVPTSVYYANYLSVDVCLDPFPYGGGTTTFDAVRMGVPVVTLRGRTAVGRGGASILSNLGLPQAIAEDEEQYIQIAAALAGDLNRLSQLRYTLPERMRQSPLMDESAFVRDMENLYRQMWRAWCEEHR
ncbi:MAG: tetratricopeptide repeat protein [Tepidisphaeraceae bacterium]|jgi:predicted O-linked N-acetylglucosamine transferase (SPINDLY family)